MRSLSASDWWSLVRFAHIFSSAVREILEQQLFHEVSGNGLTLSQFHLLEFIALGDKRHQMLDVAAFLGVSTAAATKNVDKLQRLGLVNRKPFPGDRRVTLLSLSRKGRRVVEQYAEVEQKKLATVLHRFRSAELTTLARLLERCSIELVRAGGDAHAVCLRCAGHFDEECSIRHLHAGCPY
ncbi:MAG TPA: MarR family transcriptional regulator, partial [Thermoanaerobaculia bacterium]